MLLLSWMMVGLAYGQLMPFKDNVELHSDFQQNNLVGWTSLDLDGLNSAGPFQDYPGKGGPLGFIVYNPSATNPVNTLDGYGPHSGKKYFASISSYSGPVNDWLISNELAPHPGGTFSFYAKSAATFAGVDKIKVGYSKTNASPADFTFVSNTPTSTTGNWVKYQFTIPAGAKYLAINSVSEAFMLLVDDIEFAAKIDPLAPNTITGFSAQTQMNNGFKAVFNWVNPTTDTVGNTLNNFTGVKVYRGTHPMNLVEIANIPSSAGQSMTYTDSFPQQGSYMHRFVPYNSSGDGIAYNTPLTFFGYETVPGAPKNVTVSQDGNLHTVISWDPVNYGETGGVLQNPVVGYKIMRSLGSITETLTEMHTGTTYTETSVPPLNLYTYTVLAQTSPSDFGVPAIKTGYSGLNAKQVAVTTGNIASDQVFELGNGSIISQSIYTPDQIGAGGLITSLSYFGNLGSTSKARYKIYMSVTGRSTFGTTLNNAVWEYFGNQKLLYDGDIDFVAGRKATTIKLDQPFYYNAGAGQNVIITIVKPLLNNPPSINPREFFNTPVEGMRTYFAIGYSVDLSAVTTQPAAWSTEEVPTIPSIVAEKITDFSKISGKVTLSSDGSALKDVTITITPDDPNSYQKETVTTDANGNYNIPALIPGNYIATFTKTTFNTVQIKFTVAANEHRTLNAALDNSVPISISGSVVDHKGNPIQGVTMNLTGFSESTTTTNATGQFTLSAFADKQYELKAAHPLYNSQTLSFKSNLSDHHLNPIVLTLALNKPGNVEAINDNGVGKVQWKVPVGYYKETKLGWGSFLTAGDAWGNGGDPFIAAVRFEPSDLQSKLTQGAELSHVKVYFANHAQAIVKIFEGANAGQLIHSQQVSIPGEDWYTIELSKSIPVDLNKELWIGIEFLSGQYGSYPIGLDDGPNAPGKKGSMKYENGTWTAMSLTNKNWNIYGITNHTMEANPSGYKVYRSPASESNWTELTPASITQTSFSDSTLNDAAPNIYKYGVEAHYDENLISEKGISNEVEHKMFFDFTVKLNSDSGSAKGAYVSLWNDNNFAEATTSEGGIANFNHLMNGSYNLRVELENFEIVELNNILINANQTYEIPVHLLKVKPANLTATIEAGNSAKLQWTLHQNFIDKIERYKDFERQNIGNYLLKDLDGLETYTYNNFTWPNAGAPMSFMVFNPYATTPPVNSITAFSGRRFLTAFAGPDGANNDWLIIPAGKGKFNFNAASLTNEMLENIQVLYSTTGNEVSDFTTFGDLITVPAQWTKYSFDAPQGTKYVAINYVSDDSYILKIDDLEYEKEYNHALYYNIYLDGALVKGQHNSNTFTLENLSAGEHTAEVEAIYSTGASEKATVVISILNVENHERPEFSVYPNPSTGKFWIKLDARATVKLFDLNGRLLFTTQKEAGTKLIEHQYPSGTYIIQVQSEKGTHTKKLIFK